MKQVVLNITEEKYQFFMELLKSLDFVEVDEGDSDEEILANLERGFDDMIKHKKSVKAKTSLEDFLNEL